MNNAWRVLGLALCVVVSCFQQGISAEKSINAEPSKGIIPLESMVLRKGDTLWGYWTINARTREMYEQDWSRFLAEVSAFNRIAEWRRVAAGTVVHVPLPAVSLIGFHVKGERAAVISVVLEQSNAGPGFYRLRKMAAHENLSSNETASVTQPEAQVVVEEAIREQEIARRNLEETSKELQSTREASGKAERLWARRTFSAVAAWIITVFVFLIVLFLWRKGVVRAARARDVLMENIAEQDRARARTEHEITEVRQAAAQVQQEANMAREALLRLQKQYDTFLAEEKKRTEQLDHYLYRFVVSRKWFRPPDAGKVLFMPKKEEQKRVLLKPYGAEDWMLVENVEHHLKASEVSRKFYGLGDPVQRRYLTALPTSQ